jgi:hypothetical protein
VLIVDSDVVGIAVVTEILRRSLDVWALRFRYLFRGLGVVGW